MHIILSNISPSLKILNAKVSNRIYNVMHKSTLITYFITSLLNKHSIKKRLKTQLV